jgi:CMP/dCMP kinase
MIIAIDGPAGAGKSTAARAIAERFGYVYVDTGAMYRSVALAVLEQGLDSETADRQIAALARSLPLAFKENGQRVFLGERDISELIRTPQIGELTSKISSIPAVRAVMVELQRRLAREGESECGGAVLEGRDIQTVVFPDAPVKIFLTADAGTRASRRLEQWQETSAAKTKVSLDQARHDVVSRDERDSTREASPLRAAPDAVILATDDLSKEQVIERIERIVAAKMAGEQG